VSRVPRRCPRNVGQHFRRRLSVCAIVRMGSSTVERSAALNGGSLILSCRSMESAELRQSASSGHPCPKEFASGTTGVKMEQP
jgi:hypothetical protein